MIFFDFINGSAVFATALLMMAVSTLWYSSIAFRSVWDKEVGTLPSVSKSTKGRIRILGITFGCYVVGLALLSYFVTVASLLSVTPLRLASLLTLFAMALFGLLSVSEGKSLSYYIMHGGFLVVFIIGGALILEYWPW